MNDKLLNILKSIETLDDNELFKVKLWVDLNLQNRSIVISKQQEQPFVEQA